MGCVLCTLCKLCTQRCDCACLLFSVCHTTTTTLCYSLPCRLSPPLGLGKGASSTDVLRFVFDLDIPLLNGRVPFQRTAYELVRRCSGAEIPEGILKDQVGVGGGVCFEGGGGCASEDGGTLG